MEKLDPIACYRVLETRDARFDGRLFVGVTSTGIYCRPICPARTPKPANCRFFRSAAAAQEAGFRPCLRCRPETAPDLGAWRGTSNTVHRGLALIAAGALDGDGADVESLAARLGVGDRQLRRLFQKHLGVSPLAVAQTRRVLFAKQLLHETRMPMMEVALASGFGSVRRFNETFQKLFHRPPSALRRKSVASLPEGSVAATGVSLQLRYHPPYEWASMLANLGAQTDGSIDHANGESYCRAFLFDGQRGSIEVAHRPERASLAVSIRFPCVRALPAIVARVRRLFDINADVAVINAHLSQDPLLEPLVSARPGLRAPGPWDAFETAMGAVLRQYVRADHVGRVSARVLGACSKGLFIRGDESRALLQTFPDAAQVAAADLSFLEEPCRRSLKALAAAALADPALFQPFGAVEDAIARLSAVSGIDNWTAQYIALSILRETDAFPADDLMLRRSATQPGHRLLTAEELYRRAEVWRPWRAYAAQHLRAATASEGAAREVRYA